MSVSRPPKVTRQVSSYLSQIGRKGGLKSQRSLSPEQATMMVKVREAQKAFRKYHARCFWSYDPSLKIKANDVSWVAEQLMKNGNRALWMLGRKLALNLPKSAPLS
jgi:hypothetical protein